MDNAILAIIQAGAMLSISAFVFSRGLGTRISDLRYFGKRPGLLFRSLLSVDVLVPLIAISVILLIQPEKATAIGLVLMASSPAAPMALKKISKAGGKEEYAVSLHLVLASLAIITTPVTLAALTGLAGFQLKISPLAVAERVGLSILLPIIAGMIVGWLLPGIARRIIRPLEAVSNVVLLLVTAIVLLFTYQLLLMLDIWSYIAIVLMIIGALIVGHLMAWGRPEEQTTLALESATRNFGLALLIASGYGPLEQALPSLVPYLVTSAIIARVYIWYRKKGKRFHEPSGPD